MDIAQKLHQKMFLRMTDGLLTCTIFFFNFSSFNFWRKFTKSSTEQHQATPNSAQHSSRDQSFLQGDRGRGRGRSSSSRVHNALRRDEPHLHWKEETASVLILHSHSCLRLSTSVDSKNTVRVAQVVGVGKCTKWKLRKVQFDPNGELIPKVPLMFLYLVSWVFNERLGDSTQNQRI